jgi:hypothetical protein
MPESIVLIAPVTTDESVTEATKLPTDAAVENAAPTPPTSATMYGVAAEVELLKMAAATDTTAEQVMLRAPQGLLERAATPMEPTAASTP